MLEWLNLPTQVTGSTSPHNFGGFAGMRRGQSAQNQADLKIMSNNFVEVPGGLQGFDTNGGEMPCSRDGSRFSEWAGAREALRDTARGRQTASRSLTNLPMSQNGTIEDQIRQVDKILKECDHSRKGLENVARRLDDLNDEVKRYREFLGHEKARRDPALYKTNNMERPSVYNDNICGTMSSLTSQLTMEWMEKLRAIYSAINSPPPSTPGSRGSDRN